MTAVLNTTLEDNISSLLPVVVNEHNRSFGERIHIILPYSIIFLLAVAGNVLVIITLMVNKRMRTVTNVFLFNLAISDLLLGVLCMPFTLTGVLLREFIFGAALCRLIPYFQAVSVSVSAWTLVAMSVERYFAICHPLKSREWQTLSHAYKTLTAIWIGSLLCMLPILLLSNLQNVKGTEKYKCRESWPTDMAEKTFNIFLDFILLIIPLIIMSVTYCLIIRTLWRAMGLSSGKDFSDHDIRYCWRDSPNSLMKTSGMQNQLTTSSSLSTIFTPENSFRFRTNNLRKGIAQKKRIIKMLFVVVLEFFICWTPLYTINTITLFNSAFMYAAIGYNGISFFQLLAYTSSCCNPVTYCFMNSRFRVSFLRLFRCASERRVENCREPVQHPDDEELKAHICN